MISLLWLPLGVKKSTKLWPFAIFRRVSILFPKCLLSAVERIVQTFWVGGVWAVGYLVVPTLFATLDDRQLAGALAGQLFFLLNLVGGVSASLLVGMGLAIAGRGWIKMRRAWALFAMLLIVLVNGFVLQPMMQALKTQGLVAGSDAAAQFGQLHGVSSVLYLLLSIIGLYLVVTSSAVSRCKR